MRTIHLMNSAMMPRPGFYACAHIGPEKFVQAFHELSSAGWEVSSSIGYPQNAEILSRMLGRKIPVSLQQTIPGSGDVMLIMKLSYRMREKGAKVDESDFEFWAAVYAGFSVDRLIELNDMLEAWEDES